MWGRDNQFLVHKQMWSLEKSAYQTVLAKIKLEDKKSKLKAYFGLITKTLSLPSPLDSETTSLSSARIK